MKHNKKFNVILVIFAILLIYVTTGPINRYMRRVLTNVSDADSNSSLKVSFKYLDSNGNKINTNDKIYVFISSQENGQGNRITLELSANEEDKKVTKIYDQNGTNKDQILSGEYNVIIAIPNGAHKNDQIKENTKFEQNNFDVYKNGDIFNGSYKLEFQDKITVKSGESTNLDIVVKSLSGTKYSSDEILSSLHLAGRFGIFARTLKLSADIESTMAVEYLERTNNQTFGLSDNNYNKLKETKETHKVVVDASYLKETGEPEADKKIVLNLVNDNKKIQTNTCVTNSEGSCSTVFNNLNSGTYSVFQVINGEEINTDKNIKQEDGSTVSINFSGSSLSLSGINDSNYNYNYIKNINNNSNEVNLEKIRDPGILVLGENELVQKYVNHQEFKNKNVIVALAGTNGYEEINFDNEFENLNKLSVNLSNAVDSGTIKVYYLTKENIKNKNIHFKSDGREYLVVNIDCTNSDNIDFEGEHYLDDVKMDNDSFLYDKSGKVIFNFYEEKDGKKVPYDGKITTKSATAGIFLAPSASVEGATGNHSGTIIAKDYDHKSGEVHQKVYPMRAKVVLLNKIVKIEQPTEPEEPKKTKVAILKVDNDTNTVQGAKMQLLNNQNEVIDEWITDKNIHEIDNLVPGQKYIVREIEAPERYQLTPDYIFTAQDTEEVQQINIIDPKIKISKSDNNGNLLPGAVLQIVDEDNNVVEEWTTNGTSHVVEKTLERGKQYKIREKDAPTGYKIALDQVFSTFNDNQDHELVMTDEPIKITFKVLKKDSSGNLLEGAELQIIDEDNNVIEEWISGNEEYTVLNKLKIGNKYKIREKSAPEGYKVADDVEFEVKETEEVQEVVIYNSKIVTIKAPLIKILKKNVQKELIPGANMQILDSDMNVVEQWISDEKEHIVQTELKVGARYILHEEEAPVGYEKAEDIEFVVSDKLEEQEVTMVDKRIKIIGEPKVIITKQDENYNILPGAELQLLDSEGKIVEEWTSGNSEYIVDAKLEVGKEYTIREVSAPKGYEQAEDITFKVEDTKEEQRIVMTDKRIRKVEGIVETLDDISKYLAIFFSATIILLGSFLVFMKINHSK